LVFPCLSGGVQNRQIYTQEDFPDAAEAFSLNAIAFIFIATLKKDFKWSCIPDRTTRKQRRGKNPSEPLITLITLMMPLLK